MNNSTPVADYKRDHDSTNCPFKGDPHPEIIGIEHSEGVRCDPHHTDCVSLRSISSEDLSYMDVERLHCCAKASNPAYKRGRRLQLMQMLILPFIPILALIVQTSIILQGILVHRNEVMDIEAQVLYYFRYISIEKVHFSNQSILRF